MAKEGQLHAMKLEGFWADVGQPKDFLIGTSLYLNFLKKVSPENLAVGSSYEGNVLVHPTAIVGDNCKIGPNVVLGANVTVGSGVRLANCVLLQKASVRDNSWIKDSIVGWHSTVGRWSRLDNVTVLGEDVHIKDEVVIHGATILPHKVFVLMVECDTGHFGTQSSHVKIYSYGIMHKLSICACNFSTLFPI
jgi:mannose-1-phosphate guanylyltransferase